MYLSPSVIKLSLDHIQSVHPFFGMSFLAFKKADIPVGRTLEVTFTTIATDILERHFRACSTYDGYYNPLYTSDKSKRWVALRYPSTSLQRITTDTFSDALLHTKGSSDWGWKQKYVATLEKHLKGKPIPAFALAVWLYRDEEWPGKVTPQHVVNKLTKEYRLTKPEIQRLFDLSIPSLPRDWVASGPTSERSLLRIVGVPPGHMPEEGAALRYLELRYVGPATAFRYEPNERLNIVTGDNSLGKTFLLDCVWWALTGVWSGAAAFPQRNVPKKKARIEFSVSAAGGAIQKCRVGYDWDRQRWKPSDAKAVAGMTVYARYDGAFAVWDPARAQLATQSTDPKGKGHFVLERHDVWYGLSDKADKTRWICNGLLRDWVSWQLGGKRYRDRYEAFVSCLRALSPAPDEPLTPGDPVRLPLEALEIPTLKMPYDDVPVVHASAAVQRIVALAYIVVWAWSEHVANSASLRRNPQRRIILIVDEVEAHLHPRWQRLIVPAFMEVLSLLAGDVTPQVHLATHSPLVMAAAETIFNPDKDALHNLVLDGKQVRLEVLPFVKRGRADLWLMSDVFGLGQPRSLPAERAIEKAKALQSKKSVARAEVRETNDLLLEHLAPDDDFWPRWRFFAKKHGAGE